MVHLKRECHSSKSVIIDHRCRSVLFCLEEQALLNGAPFPSTLYVPLDKSYRLECQSTSKVYWKIYLKTGKLTIVQDRLILLNEFDHGRDGFYQCHVEDHSRQFHSVFIFSNGQ